MLEYFTYMPKDHVVDLCLRAYLRSNKLSTAEGLIMKSDKDRIALFLVDLLYGTLASLARYPLPRCIDFNDKEVVSRLVVGLELKEEGCIKKIIEDLTKWLRKKIEDNQSTGYKVGWGTISLDSAGRILVLSNPVQKVVA